MQSRRVSHLGKYPVHLAIHTFSQTKPKVSQFDADETAWSVFLGTQGDALGDAVILMRLGLTVLNGFSPA
jgi:hypothetical protein